MKCFVSDCDKFGGKEMLSLNRDYEISSSSLCEEASDSFASLGFSLLDVEVGW